MILGHGQGGIRHLVMVKKAKYMIFLAHLLVSTAERERGGLLGGPDVFRRLPRGSPLGVPSSLYKHFRKL